MCICLHVQEYHRKIEGQMAIRQHLHVRTFGGLQISPVPHAIARQVSLGLMILYRAVDSPLMYA